jgi:hypothetical protein
VHTHCTLCTLIPNIPLVHVLHVQNWIYENITIIARLYHYSIEWFVNFGAVTLNTKGTPYCGSNLKVSCAQKERTNFYNVLSI